MMQDSSGTADASCEQRGPRYSRRALLGTGGVGLASLVAGCSALDGGGSPSGGSDSESDLFTDISFEGQQLVVELQAGHSVDRLNLIGPEGERYAQESVAKGATTVRISVLEIDAGSSAHYPIGTTKIVPVGVSDSHISKSMDPELEVTSVDQFEGDEARDLGNVAINITNTGSAPTWVYDIYFESVPHQEAKKEGENRGTPSIYLKRPKKPQSTIISPGDTQTFVDSHSPFLFEKKAACDGRITTANLVVKVATGNELRKSISAKFSGEAVRSGSASFNQEFACKDGSISMTSKNNK